MGPFRYIRHLQRETAEGRPIVTSSAHPYRFPEAAARSEQESYMINEYTLARPRYILTCTLGKVKTIFTNKPPQAVQRVVALHGLA